MSSDHLYLSVQNITHDYGEGKGAIDISFDIRPGEIVGFIGPNGAGKTTTMRMIMGFIRLQQGQLSFFGNKISSESDFLLAQREIGYLPAENNYYSGYNTNKLLSFASRLYGKDVTSRGLEIAKDLDLDCSVEITKLSSGNQRKVGVVAAVMHQPKLVILDEPTTGLDPLIQQKVLKQLEQVRSAGGSVFLSSHLLAEVEQICDRIIMIKDARIIIKDTTKNILARALRKFVVQDLPESELTQLEQLKSVQEVKKYNGNTTIFATDPKPVIDILVQQDRYDFTVEQPKLEEMFLNEYGNNV